MKLTKEQIDTVVSWLESYETLRLTSIPMRFREDFSEKPPVKEYYLKKDLHGVEIGAKLVFDKNENLYSVGNHPGEHYYSQKEVDKHPDFFGVVGSAEEKQEIADILKNFKAQKMEFVIEEKSTEPKCVIDLLGELMDGLEDDVSDILKKRMEEILASAKHQVVDEPKCNCKITENINGEDIIIIVGNNPKSDIKEALGAMDRFFKDGKKS